jgi:hypothetical protein
LWAFKRKRKEPSGCVCTMSLALTLGKQKHRAISVSLMLALLSLEYYCCEQTPWPRQLFFLFFRWDRVSLCSPGCPGTHSVDQAGLKLRNPPASASWVLGLKACATTPGFSHAFLPSLLSHHSMPQFLHLNSYSNSWTHLISGLKHQESFINSFQHSNQKEPWS